MTVPSFGSRSIEGKTGGMVGRSERGGSTGGGTPGCLASPQSFKPIERGGATLFMVATGVALGSLSRAPAGRDEARRGALGQFCRPVDILRRAPEPLRCVLGSGVRGGALADGGGIARAVVGVGGSSTV